MMIDKISYFFTATPTGRTFCVSTFEDTLGDKFVFTIICPSEFCFFPSMLMSGLVNQRWLIPAHEMAVRVKNRIEENMQLSGMKWNIKRDEDDELTLEIQ